MPRLPKQLKRMDGIDLPFEYKAKHFILDKVPYASRARYWLLAIRNRLPVFCINLFVFLIPPAALVLLLIYFNPGTPLPPTEEMSILTQAHNLYFPIMIMTLYAFNNRRLRVLIPYRRLF